MFCTNCGKEIDASSAFCPGCGNPVNNEGAPVVAPVNNQAPVENPAPAPAMTPTEVPAANPVYNQVPAASYNPQNVVYAKKPKNKLVVIIACIVAAVIVGVGGFFAVSLITAEDHEEVAENYAKASLNADYDGITSRIAFDIDEMFYDMLIMEYMEDDDLTEEEAFEELKEEAKEEGDIDIDDEDEVFEKWCESRAKSLEDSKYSYKIEVKDSEKIDNDELEEMIEDLKEEFEEEGLKLKDYMDVDDIKEAYEVELSIKTKSDDADDWGEPIERSFTVVKMGMKWKVLDFSMID